MCNAMEFYKFLLFADGIQEGNSLIGTMTNIGSAGYMDTQGQQPSDTVYGLSHYYATSQNSAAAASESWKNHQEQYSASFSAAATTNKEDYHRDLDSSYHQTSIGNQTITTVPPSSGSPYSNQESQSLLLWNRSNSAPNEEITESRGTPSYDCY